LAEEISTYLRLVIQALALAAVVDLVAVAAVVSVVAMAVDLVEVAVVALQGTDLLVAWTINTQFPINLNLRQKAGFTGLFFITIIYVLLYNR
jgi:hypothetical protein